MKLRFAGDAVAAREAQFVERVRRALELPPDVELKLAGSRRGAKGDIALEYALTWPIQVQGAEFGAADGVFVDEAAVAELHFDTRGALIAHRVAPKDARHLESIKDNIRKLAAQDAIYVVPAGAPIDAGELLSAQKPWIVSPDARGRLRLKRAFIE